MQVTLFGHGLSMSHDLLEMLQYVPMVNPVEQADGVGDVNSSAT
jgi:hypothetical protein